MIRRIDHVNIASENIVATRDFFVNALGLEEGPLPSAIPPGMQVYWLYAESRPLVHLRQAKGPVHRSSESVLSHAAFEVADIEAIAQQLERNGVAFKRFEQPGVQQLFLEGPEGLVLELNART